MISHGIAYRPCDSADRLLRLRCDLVCQSATAQPQSATAGSLQVSVQPAAQPGETGGTAASAVPGPPAASVQPATQSPSESNKIKELKELKALLDAGALTQEEFDLEKQKILAGPKGFWVA